MSPLRSAMSKPTLVVWTTSNGPTATELSARWRHGTVSHRVLLVEPANPTDFTLGVAENVARVGAASAATEGPEAASGLDEVRGDAIVGDPVRVEPRSSAAVRASTR